MEKVTFKFGSDGFLSCSCGNDVMDSGFDQELADCSGIHYECGRCGATACTMTCDAGHSAEIAEVR